MKSQYPAQPDNPQAPGAMRLRCALRLDARTLSAWRDRLLSPAEDARVSAHLADDDCAACQAQLAAYDAIAVTLRAQRAPSPTPLDLAALRPLLLQAPTAQPRLRLLPFRRAARASQPSRPSRTTIPTSFAAPQRAAPAATSGVSADVPTRGAEGADSRPLADPRLSPGWAAAQRAPTGGALRLVDTGNVTSLSVARTRHGARDGLWRGLGAAVAVALLVTALAQLLLQTAVGRSLLGTNTAQHGTPVANLSPTPSAHHPVARLQWTQAALPPGFQPDLYSTNAIAVAPSDGLTAYACYPTGDPSQSSPQVWVTHDAHTWRQATSFPTSAEGWCAITIDTADPNRMIVGLAWPGPPDTVGNSPDKYIATEDGGQTWRQVMGLGNVDLAQLATLDGAQFAFVQPENAPSPIAGFRLYVSRDDMQTWAPTDAGIIGADASSAQDLYELWANPFTNELAMLTLLGGSPKQPYLWESRDEGQTWRVATHLLNAAYVMQTPAPGQAWRYCVYDYTAVTATSNAGTLDCAPVDSATVKVWPGIGASFTDDTGTPISPDSLFALASNGDALASSTVSENTTVRVEHVYRFSASSGRWQDLGLPPNSPAMLFYAPTATGGSIIWTTPDPYGGTTALYTAIYS
ncbi:MAG TPA: hypothetical protein VMV29_01665 [Ktedonobacterales bacterium]|nr:hypothetical protein [Ktedonobacterales bacterium]